MSRGGYRWAVEWIALNDETAEESVEEMALLISVCLVADMFGKSPHEVASAVVLRRRKLARERDAGPEGGP